MRRIRAACVLALSVLSTASFSTITAMAATQAQDQSVYSKQSQEVNTHSAGDITQDETSSLSSVQTQTTQKQSPSQSVDNSNHSYVNSTQDHSVTANGSYNQDQTDKASSTLSKTVTDTSAQITTSASSNSQQHSTVEASGTFDVKQSDESVILGSQSQTAQEQSTATPGSTRFNFQTTNALAPTPVNPVGVGYGIFDVWGNLLSDSFGNIPNVENNAKKQFDVFAPGLKTTVYIAAVNIYGQPITNQNTVTVKLSSNNPSSFFESPDTMEPTQTVTISAGAFGVPVRYVNVGSTSSFDILDAYIPVHRAPHTSLPPVEASTQTQSAKTSDASSAGTDTSVGSETNTGTTVEQSQTTVVKADTSQQQNTPISQTSSLTQSAQSTQDQTVSTETQPPIHQEETSGVNAQPTSNNTNVQSASVDVTQSESAPNSTQLSQSQAVTVLGSVINVILSQLHSTDPSTGTNLTESIHADVPITQNTGWSTIVNVTYKETNQQQQYTLNTYGPITINESQTADNAQVTQSASIDYTVGGTQYHIPLSQ